MARPRPAVHRVRSRLGLVVLAATVVAGCSTEAGGDDGPGATAGSVTEAVEPGTDAAGRARVLDDPDVDPGTCVERTVTPPTAATTARARVCRPGAATADRALGVVLVHGGGGTTGEPEALTPWEEAYTAAGITTVNVAYELFDPGDDAPVFPRPEQDVKAAVQWLRGVAGHLGVDRDRIVVHGFSAGARLGAVAFTTPDHPAFDQPAGERWDGISDRVDAFIGLYHPYDGTVGSPVTYYGGQRDDPDTAVRERWWLADALLHAGDAAGPALLVTGEDDWDLQITQAQDFVERLEAAGRRAEVLVVPDADHGFDVAGGGLTSDGEDLATHILAWLDAHLADR